MDEPPPLPPRPRPPRPPGTYSAGHERDANPQIGRIVLIVLAVVCLGLQGAEFLFLPHANLARLLAAAVRVTTSWACFIAVAAGLGWARWPLAVFHVGLSLWLFVHALMGTFAAAYPGLSFGASGVPLLLGTLFLAAGGWFGLSADLSAYLDRERAGVTVGSRLVTAAGLAVALGVPAAVGGLVTAMTLRRVEPRAGFTTSGSIPLPPQNDDGAHFALILIQRAVQAKDFGVFTAEMSPEIKAQTPPKWVRQMSDDLTRRGPPLGFRLSNVVFNLSYDQQREMTFCNVIVLYEKGELWFHCNLSRNVGAKDWKVDTVFVE